MGKWIGNKINPESINNGNEYEIKDRVSIQQLNAIVNNSLYASNKADEVESVSNNQPDISDISGEGSPSVSIINAGTTGARLKFSNIKGERGDKGDVGTPNVLTIGLVTSGDIASATITGTSPNQTLNLVLPRGEQGIQGEKGEQGIQGEKGERGERGEQGKVGATFSYDSTTKTLTIITE